jgi:hypothetical protein
MKFAIIALLGLASIDAIKLHQRSTIAQGPPTAADIVGACDADSNGELTRDEVSACIDAHVPADKQEEAHAAVEEHWGDVDTDNSGTVNEAELAAAMAAHPKGPPPALS